jgi:circadian clock protein KaiC
LITDGGLTVLPITSVGLAYGAPSERVSTGVPELDRMLGGGVFRGSMVLVSGDAGTGKTTMAAAIVDAACGRGEQALFISFEESPDQLVRNMASVGIDLRRWVDAGLLQMWSERATAYGLESHLGRLEGMLDDAAPTVVALDGIGSLGHVVSANEVSSAATREMDLIKSRGITGVLTRLTYEADDETSALQLSSLIDTWLLVRNTEADGERNRLLFVIKSRGMAHSNQVREFILTTNGPELLSVCVGPEGVVTGSARASLEAGAQETAARRNEEVEALRLRWEAMDGQIALMRRQLAEGSAVLDRLIAQESPNDQLRRSNRTGLVEARDQGLTAQLAQEGD